MGQVWAPDGRELFYLDESGALTVVSVDTSGPTFIHGSPRTVFAARYAEPRLNPARHYDVSRSGRFLMLKDSLLDRNVAPASMVVVRQWLEELRERVPVTLRRRRLVQARGVTGLPLGSPAGL